MLFCSVYVYGQKMIEGFIWDEKGNPIGKATISSQNKNGSTVSDGKGYFRISVSPRDTILRVSNVGFSNVNVPISNRNVVEVVLKENHVTLSEVEVVRTGYQAIPKERSTGSFGQITSKDLLKRVSSTILEKLEGLVPGLQYDNRTGNSIINIRGINTMSDHMMGPLIVVDNFPFSGELKDINPNDVESVTLLKDAAATSIWGARAGNGVLVINMKQSKNEIQDTKLQFTTNLVSVNKPRLFDVPQIATSDFIDVERFLFDKRHYDQSYLNNQYSRSTVFSPLVDLLYDHDKGVVSDEQLQVAIAEFKNRDYRNDLLKYFYQNSITQQHHLSLSGGSTKHAYLFSLGYDGQTGGLVGQRDDKLTANLQNTWSLGKRMKLIFSNRFTYDMAKDYSARFDYNYSTKGGRTGIYPYAQLVGAGGEALSLANGFNQRYVENLSTGHLMDWVYRPFEEMNKNQSSTTSNHTASQINWNYIPITGLDLSVLYNNEIQTANRDMVYLEDSYFARNMINTFSQINGSTMKYHLPRAGIRDISNTQLMSHKLRIGAGYQRSFLENKHQVAAIFGYELSSTTTQGSGKRDYGYDPNLMTVQTVDYVTSFPTYDGLLGSMRIPYVGGFSKYINRFVSYYGNGSYTFKQRYIVSISGRKDASNLFGVKANERWKPLWSTGLAWVLSDEQFFAPINWLSNLKMRTSYGHSGNSGGVSSSYAMISHANALTLDLAGQPYATVTQLPNPGLKWEDVRMLNVGLDFSALNNKISGTLDFFDKKSTDLLSPDEIDPTVGISAITRNVGMVKGRGFDLSLKTNLSIGKVNWNNSLFITHSISRVKEYRGKISLANAYLLNTGKYLTPLPQKELYPVFALRFAGLDPQNGDPKGYLADVESKDYAQLMRDSLQNMTYYGTALPPYYGSFNQSFSWKGIELSFLLMFKFGHYFQKNTIQYNGLFESWRGHDDFAKRWQKPGDELITTVPSMMYPASADRDSFYAFAEPNIVKGDVLRLQDIRLAYSFNLALANKKKFVISTYALVNNVGIVWRANKSGLDPDYSAIPAARRLSVGLNCSF